MRAEIAKQERLKYCESLKSQISNSILSSFKKSKESINRQDNQDESLKVVVKIKDGKSQLLINNLVIKDVNKWIVGDNYLDTSLNETDDKGN